MSNTRSVRPLLGCSLKLSGFVSVMSLATFAATIACGAFADRADPMQGKAFTKPDTAARTQRPNIDV